MEILDQAIKKEGGVTKLAQALNTTQSNVSNWRVRGVPKAWLQVLTLRYGPAPTRRSKARPAKAES